MIISECHIYEIRGVGIYLDDGNLHQINVTGCHISYNDQGGVVVRGGNVRNLQIGSCDIEGNMSPDTPPTANVLIDTTAGGSVGEIVIAGCTIQHDHRSPGSANVRIVGPGPRRSQTEELRDANITIADNVLSDVQVNIDIRDKRAVTIVGNTIGKGYTHDLRIERSSNIVVGPNVFDRNPRYHYGDGDDAKHGLVFVNCEDSTVTGVHVRGTGGAAAGLLLENCRRFNVTGCTVLDCDNVGLLMKNVSDSRVSDCLIGDNRAQSKRSLALKVIGGHGNMIVDNLFSGAYEADPASAHFEGNRVAE